MKSNTSKTDLHKEIRHLIVYGYTQKEMGNLMKRYQVHLPEYIKISVETQLLMSKITITGELTGIELLRFKINRYHQDLIQIFTSDVISTEERSLAEVLGSLLKERELTVSCAESCTGGNIAHRITQQPGSSSYFLGSVVSYANDVKTNVLGVPQKYIDQYGAVSRQVVESMADGASRLMRTDCSMSTSGIAGPDGGTKYKPVGTVWVAAKYGKQTVSECKHFDGNRNEVIEQATSHAMVMLINLLKNTYEEEDELADE